MQLKDVFKLRRTTFARFEITTKVLPVDFEGAKVDKAMRSCPKPFGVVWPTHETIIAHVARQAAIRFRVLIAICPD